MSAPATIHLSEGIYDGIPATDYHADPCPAPSLSSSLASIICSQSARHAWTAHPRLNPRYEPERSDKFDLGSAAHDVLLTGAGSVSVVNAADWRTKDAQTARDLARTQGRIPILAHQWAQVSEMVAAARSQLDAHADGPQMFRHGLSEQTLIWREPDFGNIWCRARLDYFAAGRIDDLKTTAASANPDQWTRTLFAIGADIQTAFYLRGLAMLAGGTGVMRYAVVETEPPYALSVIALGPAAMTLGEKKVLYALESFARCLAANDWPGYPRQTCYADLPPWEEARWVEKEQR